MQKIIALIILIFSALLLKSQTTTEPFDKPFIAGGPEIGVITLTTQMNETDYIRGEVSAYQGYGGYNGYAPSSTVYSTTLRTFYGFKAELYATDKFIVSGGLRYINNESHSGDDRSSPGNSSYFYWLWKTDGINTDYLRVEDYTQNTSYIGIPIELKLNMVEMNCCRWYLKAGTELSLMMANNIDLDFHDESMEVHEDELVKMVNDPRPFNAALYAAGGLTLGKKYLMNLEVLLPFGMLYPENDALLSPIVGTGFRIDFMIPLKYKSNEQ